jgi:hypothetical protein
LNLGPFNPEADALPLELPKQFMIRIMMMMVVVIMMMR